MTENNVSSSNPEQWEVAGKYAQQYGNMPSSFTSLIRSLRKDEQEQGGYTFASRYQLKRLLRGDSFRSPMFFAAKTFRPELLKTNEVIGLDDIVNCFKPSEIDVILAVLYLYRRARKLCPSEEWNYLTEGFHLRLELGGFVGLAIPNTIGLATGLIAEAMGTLAAACFLMNDEKGFREYRRQLKINKQSADFSYQLSRWGCTQAQIGANLLIRLGFSSHLVDLWARGLSIILEPMERGEGHAATIGIKVTHRWVDALLETGAEPDMAHNVKFYPEKADLNLLLERAHDLTSNSNTYNWLERTKNDISPTATPELFADANSETTQDGHEEAHETASDLDGDTLIDD